MILSLCCAGSDHGCRPAAAFSSPFPMPMRRPGKSPLRWASFQCDRRDRRGGPARSSAYLLPAKRSRATFVAAGLNIVEMGGILFKPLANFQFDTLLEKQIIMKDYLDGCYMLGKHYPELCASIYAICEADH